MSGVQRKVISFAEMVKEHTEIVQSIEEEITDAKSRLRVAKRHLKWLIRQKNREDQREKE